jgi:hypothetical protein
VDGRVLSTPKINAQASRDHWPQCYTVLLAGGGVKAVSSTHRQEWRLSRQGPGSPRRPGGDGFYLLGIDPATQACRATGL